MLHAQTVLWSHHDVAESWQSDAGREQGRTEAHGAAAAAAGDAAASVVDASRGEGAERHAIVVHARQVTQATALCTPCRTTMTVGGTGA